MKERTSSGTGGYPANAIVIPLAAVIAVLHIVIMSIAFEINRCNGELSETVQKCSDYQQYVTNLQAGCSTLSETASAFVQMPAGNDGSFNVGPLLRYAQELRKDRRGTQVSEWFRDSNVSPKVQACIDTAAKEDEQMHQIQIRVIGLLCSVCPMPPVTELAAIPDYPLSEEELDMTKEERFGLARSLIFGKAYSLHRAAVAENVENCHRMIDEEYSRASAELRQHIASLRVRLWIVITAIIVIMLCAFILFYVWLIRPLWIYARQISSDKSAEQTSGIREVRQVFNAYNALLKRHDKLESILRSAAEKDVLTGLPNRYSLEKYVLENGEDGRSMAVLLFDLDYLKRENDTKGHEAGDRLLRTAAYCLRDCFGTAEHGCCYRIGGDEFAAVLRVCTEEEARSRADRFLLACERERISVSVGCAFAEKAEENTFELLMKQADRRMYAHKKRIHAPEVSVGAPENGPG